MQAMRMPKPRPPAEAAGGCQQHAGDDEGSEDERERVGCSDHGHRQHEQQHRFHQHPGEVGDVMGAVFVVRRPTGDEQLATEGTCSERRQPEQEAGRQRAEATGADGGGGRGDKDSGHRGLREDVVAANARHGRLVRASARSALAGLVSPSPKAPQDDDRPPAGLPARCRRRHATAGSSPTRSR